MEIFESENYRQGVEVMGSRNYIGFVDIDPFKGMKSKQKATVYSPKLETHIEANISFTITVSDSFKIIEKLIPPNCLCGP